MSITCQASAARTAAWYVLKVDISPGDWVPLRVSASALPGGPLPGVERVEQGGRHVAFTCHEDAAGGIARALD